jgi:hypothetical protein
LDAGFLSSDALARTREREAELLDASTFLDDGIWFFEQIG